MTLESNWANGLDETIGILTQVAKDERAGRIRTAEDYLTAAKAVETAIRTIEPTAVDTESEPPATLVTVLVRNARRPPVGKPATWTEVGEIFDTSPQRAHDRHAPGRANRLLATRERIQSYREPAPRKDLPGVSAAEAEAHFGIGRTALRGFVAKEKVHAWPLMDDAGQPVTVLRNGKPAQNLRYFLEGVTAAEAAKTLEISLDEVTAKAERGEIGRSMILDHETQKPVTDEDGQPIWQYFPEHTTITTT